MLKKLINKIIMETECYVLLKNRFKEVEREKEEIVKYFGIESLTDNITHKKTYRSTVLLTITKNLEEIITKDKKIARKIIRTVNSLLKKDESVHIKALCNQIIKGEEK